jgi:capsular polysaccharide biosynthesis protein
MTGRAIDGLALVTDLAAATTDAVQVFADPQAVPIPKPLFIDTLEPLPALTQDIVSRTQSFIDPRYLAKLHHVLLTGDRDLVTRDGVYLTDLWNQAGLHTRAPGPRPAEGTIVQVAAPCGLLFHNASSGDNHSHWLLQTLPQLAYYEHAGISPQFLVVQPNIRPYQREVLAALGYGPDRLLLRNPRQPMRFRTLYAGYVDGGLVPDSTIFDRQIAAFDTARSVAC